MDVVARGVTQWHETGTSGVCLGAVRRPAMWTQESLLLSDERLNGKNRLDYGEPCIIS